MKKEEISKFHSHTMCDAYNYLGSHFVDEEQKTVIFRVYAPHASFVSIVGDFNNWHKETNPMIKITDGGIWEAKINGLKEYDNYKYYILNSKKKSEFFKSDPFQFHGETNGQTCSKVYNIEGYQWQDKRWMDKRDSKNIYNSPMNIYEVHLGSWKKYKNGTNFNYRQMADKLIPYVKKNGFTHIEIMPIMEYPFDGSWGYQVTGYFSVTSRYGTPKDFMYFIDKAHNNGIGIILDWVPAHFPKDSHGLYEFDGESLFEDPVPTKMEHKSWGTRIFNFGKTEISNFLISSCLFFYEKFHVDGIRVDAVASMLYLDYDRKDWKPNVFGGNYHLEAVDFLKRLNIEVFKRYPNAIMAAEESTAFPSVTKPVHDGGLGFNFKWNMGWMNDTLSYIKLNPYFRINNHSKINFSIWYAFSENFILPISHDEVVHGKASLLNKMPGDYEEKFAGDRCYLGYMMTHPGKKLHFMGYEFGQFIEWNYKQELDWLLLNYDMHKKLATYVKDLNKFYIKNKCLWEQDFSLSGFSWINADDADHNVLSYIRYSLKKKDLIIIINFAGIMHRDYRIGLKKGFYKEVFNSNLEIYGGSDKKTDRCYETTKISCNNQKNSITLNLPKLSIIILKKSRKGK